MLQWEQTAGLDPTPHFSLRGSRQSRSVRGFARTNRASVTQRKETGHSSPAFNTHQENNNCTCKTLLKLNQA